MTTFDIERMLRQPAPDEPSVLPSLVLPRVTATGGLRDRSLDTPLGFGRMTLTMRVAIAALLLAAVLVGALVSGALRIEQLRSPLLKAGEFTGRGVSLTYPAGWERVTPAFVIEDGSSVALIVSNTRVDGCSADQVGTLTPVPPSLGADGVYYSDGDDQFGKVFTLGDRIYACTIERPMHPGEIRVVLTQNAPQRIQIGPVGDFAQPFYDAQSPGGWNDVVPGAANGFTETIGGMPALLDVRDSVIPGADEVRTWIMAGPDWAGSMWHVQAVIAGPDLPELREEADAVARSFAFQDPPEPLTDTGRDAALAKTIDEFDRQMRRSGSRLAGCLPRTPGEVTATVTEGIYAALREPVDVTCTTTIQATEVRQWRATITVSWPARDGVPAGRWGWELFFGADGTGGMQGRLYPEEEEAGFPNAFTQPLPAGPMPVLEPGTLVRVVGTRLQTGIIDKPTDQGGPSSATFIEGMPGHLFTVVDGPVEDDGLTWYRLDSGSEVGWTVPWADGRPLLEAVDPASVCPTVPAATVEDLVYLPTLVRRLCAGDRELTFGPSQYARREEVSGDELAGEPAWLATPMPFWALFGSGGAKGIDAGLPAVLAPGVTKPAAGAWITVRGHFNDPAADTCSWSYPESWGMEAMSPETQHRRCAEIFVITSIEPADAP